MQNSAPGFGALIPLIILMIPIIFINYRLAKDKGKNIVKYTILGFIPLLNYIALVYLVGTPNLILDKKVDRILTLLEASGSRDQNKIYPGVLPDPLRLRRAGR